MGLSFMNNGSDAGFRTKLANYLVDIKPGDNANAFTDSITKLTNEKYSVGYNTSKDIYDVDWDTIATRVNNNEQPYTIGTMIHEKWTDLATGIIYDNPWRVVGYKDVTVENGSRSISGMFLENVYTHPYTQYMNVSIPLCIFKKELEPGAYSFSINLSGDIYYNTFTTTKTIPVNGCIKYVTSSSDTPFMVCSCNGDGDIIEEIALANVYAIDNTILLGKCLCYETSSSEYCDFYPYVYYIHGDMPQPLSWARSDIRKYLNSSEKEWYSDIRYPEGEYKSYYGYLTGLSDSFIKVLLPFEQTSWNAVDTINVYYTNGSSVPAIYDCLYDKVSIASASQIGGKVPSYYTSNTINEDDELDFYKIMLETITDSNILNSVNYSITDHSSVDAMTRSVYSSEHELFYSLYYYYSRYNMDYFGCVSYNSKKLPYKPLVCIGKVPASITRSGLIF